MSARRFSLRGVVWLCALVVVGLVCSAPALASRGHVLGRAFGEKGSGDGQFNEPTGVALDEATGRVYVVDSGNNRVEYFSSTGVYEGQFNGSGTLGEGVAAGHGGLPGEVETGQFSGPQAIAVDNSKNPSDPSSGDVYVVDAGHQVIDKYTSSGNYLGQLTGGRLSEVVAAHGDANIAGVAVDPGGNVFVDYKYSSYSEYEAYTRVGSFTDAVFNEFVSEVQVVIFGELEPGLAVDAADELYLRGNFQIEGDNSRGVIKVTSSGKVLNREVGSEFASWPAVEVSSGDVYLDNVSTVGRFSPEGSPVERFGEGHLSQSAGIGVDSSTETLYVADSSADVIDGFLLELPGHPTIESVSVSDVAGGSATFNAEINPRGEPTEYRLEYGACGSPATCASSSYEESLPVPDGIVGSDFTVYSLSVHPQDLRTHTTYHFRVVAHNGSGTATDEGRVFTTQAGGGELVLPDGRQWELVTPAAKQGALFFGLSEGVQTSVNGDALVDLARTPSEVNPQGYTNSVSVLSTRGSDGWSSQVLAPPHDEATGTASGAGEEYRVFSEDLSLGILQPFGDFTALSPEAIEATPYLRSDYLNGDVSDHCDSSCYRPLVTGADTPAGTVFGQKCGLICGPVFEGASPDLSHVVLFSEAQLTSTPITQGGLYEWGGGQLQLVSVFPPGEEAEGGGTAAVEPELGEENHNTARNAISDDGSLVVWAGKTVQGGPTHLYLSDTSNHETKTVRIDARQGTTGFEGFPAPYETASRDGSRIFFLDGGKLTKEASEGELEDLYEYNSDAPLGSRLTDLTVDKKTGEGAHVVQVVGASEDGSYIYFFAGGALTPDALQRTCDSEEKGGACNLYVRHGGKTTLIAELSPEDGPDWNRLIDMPARVSPDGKWLEFVSDRDLTGYDTDDAVSGRPDEEVYLYDADSGRVMCASCNPTGSRPVGVESGEFEAGALHLTGAENVWSKRTWVASNVPPWTVMSGTSFYQPRYLSDGGRLFFDSHDALVPQDTNGTEDAYEYEPDGVGDCSSSNSAFSEQSGGCVSLISSGSSPEESAFVDASGTGSDVFFLTAAKLVAHDSDVAVDVYDAHECSSRVPCFAPSAVVPPPCSTGDSCKAAPTPQPGIFGNPASATFSGSGNVTVSSKPVVVKPKSSTRAEKLARALKACRKKGREKRRVCERKARSTYGVGKSGKANKGRRG